MTWEWNYAYGPAYRFDNSFMAGGQQVSCSLEVEEGIIKICRIDGPAGMKILEDKLSGNRHMPEEISKVIGEAIPGEDGPDPFDFF